MDTETWVTGIIAALALITSATQILLTHRQQRLGALQGTKEAVAAGASAITRKRIPSYDGRYRRAIFEGLCLAAVFERSGRTRSLIYAALNTAMKTPSYQKEITRIIRDKTLVIDRGGPYTDLTVAHRRLVALEAALNLGGDVRLRIGPREMAVEHRAVSAPFPLCADDVCGWEALTPMVRKVGEIVVVQARPPLRTGTGVGAEPLPVLLCLGFHRTPRSRSGQDEDFALTPLGLDVCTAKYVPALAPQEQRDAAARKLEELAKRLARVVSEHAAYREAVAVLAVPGGRHTFSVDLARAMAAHLAHKEFIEPGTLDLHRSDLANRSVILVDDVYRTGETWRDHAVRLAPLHCRRILGLTATCTLIDSFTSCRDEEPERSGDFPHS